MTGKTRTNISRRTALAGAAGAAAFGILRWHRADAAEFVYKLGTDATTTMPLYAFAAQAAAKVNKESDGRLKVQVYPNSQLGTDTQMIAQVRSGAMELLHIGDNILAQLVPEANFAAIPFAFSGYEQAWSAMDGPLGKYIHAQIEKKLGLKVFDKDWEAGLRHVLTISRVVRTPADMKGLKLRVPMAPITVATFKALGASPTPIDWTEVYSALQTHLVDGLEAGFFAANAEKFFEVVKHVSLTAHQTTDYSLVANGAAFGRLPKNLQEILMRNFNEAAALERAATAKADVVLQPKLESQGVTFVKPDRAAFKEVIRKAGLYAKWRDTYGAKGFTLLEQAVGKLT